MPKNIVRVAHSRYISPKAFEFLAMSCMFFYGTYKLDFFTSKTANDFSMFYSLFSWSAWKLNFKVVGYGARRQIDWYVFYGVTYHILGPLATFL